jgi:8-oxo-dGTP pyrophosphatase MutT (NUDIX family)
MVEKKILNKFSINPIIDKKNIMLDDLICNYLELFKVYDNCKSVSILIWNNDKILVHKRSVNMKYGTQKLSSPGGKIDKITKSFSSEKNNYCYEDPLDAIIRETKEELGLNLNKHMIYVRNYHERHITYECDYNKIPKLLSEIKTKDEIDTTWGSEELNYHDWVYPDDYRIWYRQRDAMKNKFFPITYKNIYNNFTEEEVYCYDNNYNEFENKLKHLGVCKNTLMLYILIIIMKEFNYKTEFLDKMKTFTDINSFNNEYDIEKIIDYNLIFNKFIDTTFTTGELWFDEDMSLKSNYRELLKNNQKNSVFNIIKCTYYNLAKNIINKDRTILLKFKDFIENKDNIDELKIIDFIKVELNYEFNKIKFLQQKNTIKNINMDSNKNIKLNYGINVDNKFDFLKNIDIYLNNIFIKPNKDSTKYNNMLNALKINIEIVKNDREKIDAIRILLKYADKLNNLIKDNKNNIEKSDDNYKEISRKYNMTINYTNDLVNTLVDENDLNKIMLINSSLEKNIYDLICDKVTDFDIIWSTIKLKYNIFSECSFIKNNYKLNNINNIIKKQSKLIFNAIIKKRVISDDEEIIENYDNMSFINKTHMLMIINNEFIKSKNIKEKNKSKLMLDKNYLYSYSELESLVDKSNNIQDNNFLLNLSLLLHKDISKSNNDLSSILELKNKKHLKIELEHEKCFDQFTSNCYQILIPILMCDNKLLKQLSEFNNDELLYELKLDNKFDSNIRDIINFYKENNNFKKIFDVYDFKEIFFSCKLFIFICYNDVNGFEINIDKNFIEAISLHIYKDNIFSNCNNLNDYIYNIILFNLIDHNKTKYFSLDINNFPLLNNNQNNINRNSSMNVDYKNIFR